jgi:hypothetical protein
MNNAICQSCGMPLEKDPNKGGSNADQSLNLTYCSYCFRNGKFLDQGISLREKIEKNIAIAVRMGMTADLARQIAESTLPGLERWR